MFKRLLAAGVLLLVVVSVTSCGKKEDTPEVSSNPSGEGKQITITAWTGSEYAKDEFEKERNERFSEKYPNIKVNTIVHDGDRVSDYITAYASGNAPDIVAISYPMLSKLVFSGLISPIDDYWNKWEEASQFSEQIVENCKINGKLYGIPGDAYLMGMAYNKKLFADAGVAKAPETWDELLETAKKLTNPANQQAGLGLLTGQWVDWWFEYFVWQAGGDLTKQNEDGTVTCTFSDPAVHTAAEFYRTLKQEKVIQADLTMEHQEIQKNFAMGKIAMTLNSIGDVQAFTNAGMKKEDIGFAMFPKGPSGENPSQFGGNLFGINSKSSDEVKEAVFTRLSFDFSRDETIEKLKFNEARGKSILMLSVRKDINPIDYQPSLADEQEFLDVMNSALDNLRLEYYAKGSVGKYIDTAVQKIVADDKADIKTEFEKAQELAEREGAADFNKEMKK